MNRIFWVRHAENWANLTKEFSCRKIDYSLTPRGVLQAAQTGAAMASLGLDAVYSSPLKRALQTAEQIAAPLGLRVEVVEDLRELNVGSLEDHLPTPEDWTLHNSILAEWIRGEAVRSLPDGEDYPTLWRRFSAALRAVTAGREGQRIAVVAHGGQLFCTLHDLCRGTDVRPLRAKDYPNCGISELELDWVDDQPAAQVISWAGHSHLNGDAASLISGVPPGAGHPEQQLLYLSGPRAASAAALAALAQHPREGWVYLDSSADDLPTAEMIARAGSVAKWRWVSAFCWVGKARREYSASKGVVIAGQSPLEDVRAACRMFHIGACEVQQV